MTDNNLEVTSNLYHLRGYHKPAYRYLRKADKIPALYSQDGKGYDAIAKVKLFGGPFTWFITEYDPETRTAFGLVVNHSYGDSELGYIDLDEIVALRIPLSINGKRIGGLPVERDLYFSPKPLKECK